MYIIEEGKAYFVEGEVGYLVNFDTTGKMFFNKEKTIDIKGKTLYTYEEMYAKLNIAYMIAQAKLKASKSQNESEELKALKDENEKLNLQIEELKNKIAELELENEELKKVPETQPLEEDKPKEEEVPKTDEAKSIKKK